MKPLIVVNFKAYEEGLGSEGLELVRLLSQYENIIMSLPAPMISIAAGYDIKDNACTRVAEIFSQHVDPVEGGAHTGSVTADEIKQAGATGSLINHSERRIPISDIKKILELLKEEDLKSIVCCQDKTEALKIKQFNPDYIAYEPPELIGGDVSVSKSKPEVIKEIVQACTPIPVLVGAGVKTREDIDKSVELGAKGVLIASGIIKAKDKKKVIKELIV